jgi:hypothetical protein
METLGKILTNNRNKVTNIATDPMRIEISTRLGT